VLLFEPELHLGGDVLVPDLVTPLPVNENRTGAVQCRARLGGTLRFYYREAA
jgi:hypothetical protein